MVKLDKATARLGESGDLTKQFEQDCGDSVREFRAAAAAARRLGEIAAGRALTAAEASAFSDAMTMLERRHSHLVSYAKLLPAIARNRHQQSSPKGPNREASDLLQGVIKAEFLAWRRGQPTQWGYDYSPVKSNSPFGGFAKIVSDHFADRGIEISPRTIINHTGAWLNEVR